MAAKRILPAAFKKLVVSRVTNKFREAVQVASTPLVQPGPGEVVVRNRYVGINASDINFTAGRYDPTVKPPFDAGFEGAGEIVAVGPGVPFQEGQSVAYMKYGAFAEYINISARSVFPIPSLRPEYIPLMVSGLTAAISMDKVGEMKAGETVLVTAAAGGTGQFAVQCAKNAGCHVIGTCSSDEKVEFLRSLGCDRAINYNKENLNDVLKTEYPKGLDVVYESVGGETFNTALRRLARKGRLVVIGYISGYESSTGLNRATNLTTLPTKLLTSSASVRGFFLFHYSSDFKEYMMKLMAGLNDGSIKSLVDNGVRSNAGPFKGLESVSDAVDYLYSRKSQGKIIVELNAEFDSKL